MRNGHDLDRVKDLLKQIEKLGGVSPLYYDIERMEEYKEALFKYAKFKIGYLVQLSKTPEISSTVRHGWIGYRDLLIKGAQGKIVDVDYYKGRFRYGVNFTQDVRDHQFCLDEEFLACVHVLESNTSSMLYKCTICGEKYQPEQKKTFGSVFGGHQVIDAEKLNELLKKIIPGQGSFDRNFIAHKIAQHENEILK